MSRIELQALGILASNDGPQPEPSASLVKFRALASDADDLTDRFLAARGALACPPVGDFAEVYVPRRFDDAVRRTDVRVAVYDVGPREQTQRLSTTARAADAISLGAAIAAQMPASGVGANGSLGLSRSAMGKADAIERVPLVTSFAEASTIDSAGAATKPAFGWLLGPRVTLDARRNKLVLDHQAKPYDLSVDLAAPGWWPYLYLDAQTAWSPDWRQVDGKTVASGAATKRIKVELGANASDLASLTTMIAGNGAVRVPSIASIYPPRISACAASTAMQISGENIWRTNLVLVAGRKFEGGDITVLPDMNGVLVMVSQGVFPARDASGRLKVTVQTPYGPASRGVELIDVKADGGCEPHKDPAPAPDKPKPSAKPTIETVTPATVSICHDAPQFQVTGKNLKAIQSVRLGSAEGSGATLAPGDGTSASAQFKGLAMKTLFAGMTSAELAIQTSKGLATKTITLAAAACP